MGRAVVVFVHGLFSSGRAWEHFHSLISSDLDLAHVTVLSFEYSSPKFNLSPLRRIPDFDVLADGLRTYLDTEAADYTDIVLVSHSQGGLVVQRYLSRMVKAARGRELQRIKRIVMYACPNSGSQLLLLVRRPLSLIWRNPQERGLRPIDEAVSDAHSTVINRVVHAQRVAPEQCPISVHAYAGMLDKVVTPTSAKGMFPDTGVLPGDHSSIIQPDSIRHQAYVALKRHLLWAFQYSTSPGVDGTPSDSSQDSGMSLGDLRNSGTPLPGFPDHPSRSTAVARLNLLSGTIEFIVASDTALEWIREFNEEGRSDG
jgi:hypothetical protein